MRKLLEPDIEAAQSIVDQVIYLIDEYDNACDNGNVLKQDLAIKKIANLTNKNIKEEDIFEYWGYINKEDLAFQLSIPAPSKQDISKEELVELIKKIPFESNKTEDFYRVLLERSFAHPNPFGVIFNNQGRSIEEIATEIINYKAILL